MAKPSRKLTLNLDKLLALGQAAPQILSNAQQAAPGMVPPSLLKYGPLAGILAPLIGGLLDAGDDDSEDDGLTAPGLPDSGPRGRGRSAYIRSAHTFSDDEVRDAALSILSSPAVPPEGQARVGRALDYTLHVRRQGNVNTATPAAMRAAVDTFLSSAVSAVSDATAERFGDMLMLTLQVMRSSPPPAALPPAPEV